MKIRGLKRIWKQLEREILEQSKSETYEIFIPYDFEDRKRKIKRAKKEEALKWLITAASIKLEDYKNDNSKKVVGILNLSFVSKSIVAIYDIDEEGIAYDGVTHFKFKDFFHTENEQNQYELIDSLPDSLNYPCLEQLKSKLYIKNTYFDEIDNETRITYYAYFGDIINAMASPK